MFVRGAVDGRVASNHYTVNQNDALMSKNSKIANFNKP